MNNNLMMEYIKSGIGFYIGYKIAEMFDIKFGILSKKTK